MSDTYVVNSAGKATIIKDENAHLDYTFDWSQWLTPIADTIAGAISTIVGDGIATIGTPADQLTSTAVTIWVTGGTIGQQYILTCKITTAAGRIDERSIYINVRQR